MLLHFPIPKRVTSPSSRSTRMAERRGERVYLGQIRLLNGWDAFFFFHAFAVYAIAISLRGGASIERKNEWQSGEEKGKETDVTRAKPITFAAAHVLSDRTSP